MYLETNILLQIVTCILYYVYVCTYLTRHISILYNVCKPLGTCMAAVGDSTVSATSTRKFRPSDINKLIVH